MCYCFSLRLTQYCNSLGRGIKTAAGARRGTAQAKRRRGETGPGGGSPKIRGEKEGRGGEKETGRVPSQTSKAAKTHTICSCLSGRDSLICNVVYPTRKRSVESRRNLKHWGGVRRRSEQRKRQLLQQQQRLWPSSNRRSRRGENRRPKDSKSCKDRGSSNKRPSGDFNNSNSSSSSLHKWR